MGIITDNWQQISNIGVTEELDPRLSRKINLTNQIVFVAGAMTFLQIFMFPTVPMFSIFCATSILLYSLTYYLNAKGWHKAARLYFSAMSCIVVLGLSSALSDTNVISFRFMLIQAFVVPMVVFDIREKKLQWVGFLFFALSFIVFDQVNEAIPLMEGIDPLHFDNPQTVVVNGVLAMFTLLLGNRYLQRLNYKAEENLQEVITETNQQRKLIEKKNKFIEQGIRYAQEIQNTVLPKTDDISILLPNHFIHFKPKEIIGGDFYWHGEFKDHILMAAVDCTGHGAPGALISIIGSQLLDRIVKHQGITDPAEVLEILNLEVISTVNQRNTVLKDGMDISLISIDTKRRTIQFAGAKNSLITMKGDQISRLRGNAMSIGETHSLEEGFTTHTFEADEIDQLIMVTDGVIDQFGGPGNKKLLHKRLYQALKKNHTYSMDLQKDCLIGELSAWQGSQDQTDDILVIGLAIDFEHIAQVKAFQKSSRPHHDEDLSIAS